MEKMCLLTQGFSCPTLFAQGLFSTLGESCQCRGPMVQVQPCGRQKVPVSMAGDGMAQHVELAFPRNKVCSEPQEDSGLGGSLLNK